MNPGDIVTLVTRLSLFFLSMLALVLTGFSVALYLVASSHLHRQADERLETMLNAVSNIIEIGPHDVEWEHTTRSLNLDFAVDGDQVVWLVADDQGHVLEHSQSRNTDLFLYDARPTLPLTDHAQPQISWSGVSWVAVQRWIFPEVGSPDYEPSTHVQELSTQSQEGEHKYAALSVTVGASLIPVRTTLTKLATALIVLSSAIWLLAFAASRFVCQRALLPVHRMAVAAREIHADDLTQRLPAIASNDELADLNCAFNDLLDRLQVAFERQRRFTGDASHQLRTPLTAILGQIEVALRRERPAHEYRQILEKVQRRASHLAGMTESLLFLARADAEAMMPRSESVNLSGWLSEHLQTWSEHSRAADMKFDPTTVEPCTIQAQPTLLGELLDILLDNACKYSEPGTHITIRLVRTDDSVLLTVEDCGCGIDETDISNLFVPFSRSEEARRRGIEGVGLGLSIAKRLMTVFGGELSVSSQAGQRTCFTLRFACQS